MFMLDVLKSQWSQPRLGRGLLRATVGFRLISAASACEERDGGSD